MFTTPRGDVGNLYTDLMLSTTPTYYSMILSITLSISDSCTSILLDCRLLPIPYSWFEPGWRAHYFRRRTYVPAETQRTLTRVIQFCNNLIDHL